MSYTPYIHESVEQTNLFRWAAYEQGKYPELKLMYHIPNGGSRNRLEAANLKKQGVKSGVPDSCLPAARGTYHGLHSEMKSVRNKATENQKQWLSDLNEQGYCTVLCYGWNAASEVITNYLEGRF